MGFQSLSSTILVLSIIGLSSWTKLCNSSVHHQHYRRQVPQEWAHASEVRTVDEMLKLDNPQEIVHPIFSLVGNQAVIKGLGKVNPKNIDCFQKIVADQAFKNAKKAKNQKGQEASIIFAFLERNTQGIGKESPPCKSLKVDSPEIQRLIQHQDAAGGAKAKENNKLSAKLAALSLKEIGSHPFLALRTGNFKTGDPKNTNKGAGFSCDDENDKEGCIYSKKLLVEDVTKAEIEELLKKEGSKYKTKDTSKEKLTT